MKERGLYLHYPFCSKICNYCDFAVDTRKELSAKYIASVIHEIKNSLKNYKNDNLISTIYIGGGTPSLMPIDEFKLLIETLNDNFIFSDDLEFSIEINPGTVTKEKFKAYRELGVNRVSIGVQSFQKRDLGMITRNHSPKSAIKAIEDAHSCGFKNISLDLMFSLPYQNLDSLSKNLQIAVDLPIEHISTYSLIYEPGTPLYEDWKRGKIKKHGEEFDAELYKRTIEILIENDFEQYEVSNFARNHKYCYHNLNAWMSEEYFAFGVSAHGYLRNHRYANERNLLNYLKFIKERGEAINEVEFINNKKELEEKFFLGMRSKGLDIRKIPTNKNFQKILESFVQSGHITLNKNKIKLSSKGYLLCDAITFKLLNSITTDSIL